MAKTEALFALEPYRVPKEHLALVSCLGDMYPFLRPGEVVNTLDRIFVKGQISNGDPFPWELCRWKERYVVVDGNDEHWLSDADHPHVNPNDFLACCDPDPGCFGPDHFWNIYTEDQLKACFEEAFSFWAKENPSRKAEYAAAMAKHGMQLR